MRLFKFWGSNKTENGKELEKVVSVVGATRQERSKNCSLESNPEEPPKRVRGPPEDEHNSSTEEVPLDFELLSEHDAETARAVEVLRQLNLPVDATCLVPQRPSNVGSWDWTFPDNVHKIELSGSSLGDELAAALATLLKPRKNESGSWSYPTSINSLLLSNAGIGAVGAVALAQMLEPRIDDTGKWTYNDGLAKLDLSDNCIGDDGATALAEALMPRQGRCGELHCNTTLKDVWLGGNRISVDGLEAIVEALFPAAYFASVDVPSSVEVLGLGHNAFGDEGACVLAGALAPVLRSDGKWVYQHCLKYLNVWGNSISGEGSLSLLSALRPRENKDGSWAFNTSLESLTMFRNHIDEASKAEMRKIIAAVNDLRGDAFPALLLMC